jgi:hypothetical protein
MMREGNLLHLGFGVGHFADQNVAGFVDFAFGDCIQLLVFLLGAYA